MFECAICACKNGRSVLEITSPDRFERSIGITAEDYLRTWFECACCGAVTNRLPSKSEEKLTALRSAYYEVDFAGSDIGEKYRRVMALPEDQSDNAGRVTRVANFAGGWFAPGTSPQVLDIGAGTGVFLSRLIDKTGGHWQCLALEPDPRAAAHLRRLEAFPILEAMYEGQTELRDFNLVTLNKVLEHIADPVGFLKKVVKCLHHDESLIYIEVPDKLTAWLRSPEDNILGALHCHLYDPISLCYLARAAGLEIVRIDRIAEPSGKLTVYAFGALREVIESKRKSRG